MKRIHFRKINKNRKIFENYIEKYFKIFAKNKNESF